MSHLKLSFAGCSVKCEYKCELRPQRLPLCWRINLILITLLPLFIIYLFSRWLLMYLLLALPQLSSLQSDQFLLPCQLSSASLSGVELFVVVLFARCNSKFVLWLKSYGAWHMTGTITTPPGQVESGAAKSKFLLHCATLVTFCFKTHLLFSVFSFPIFTFFKTTFAVRTTNCCTCCWHLERNIAYASKFSRARTLSHTHLPCTRSYCRFSALLYGRMGVICSQNVMFMFVDAYHLCSGSMAFTFLKLSFWFWNILFFLQLPSDCNCLFLLE